MGIKIKETVKNPLKKVMGSNKVQVGWFGETGKTMMLASIFEGKANPGGRNHNIIVPAWKPLEAAAPEIENQAINTIKREAANMILNGKEETLKKIALKGAEELKKTVEETKSPGNKPGTIKQKGFDNPMIRSGNFKRSASGKVNGVGTFGKGKLG